MRSEAGGVEVGDRHQGVDAGIGVAAADTGEAMVDEDAVVVVERDEVGDGAEGDEVEVVGEAQGIRPAALRKQAAAQGKQQVEGDADAGEVFAGKGAVAPVRVNDSVRRRQGFTGQVVVGDDDVNAARTGSSDGIVALDAVVHGKDKPRCIRQVGESGEAEAVAVHAAVRDEPGNIRAELAQDAHGERGRRRAVHVVVTIDEDGLAVADSVVKAVKRGVEAGEVVRRQQVLQAFFDFVVMVETAGVDVFHERVPVGGQRGGVNAQGAGGDHGVCAVVFSARGECGR